MWFIQLMRDDTINCTDTFMNVISLLNIFIGEKMAILIDFINTFII